MLYSLYQRLSNKQPHLRILQINRIWTGQNGFFQCTLMKYSGSQDTGPILWKLLVLESQSNSICALMALMQEIQKMELKQYEGENINKCTMDIFDKYNKLETAGELPKILVLSSMKSWQHATWKSFTFNS